MKNIIFATIFLILGGAFISSCKKEETTKESNLVMVTGVIQQVQGITTYQYGSHGISNDTQAYALRSQTIVLDDYVGQSVTIKGEKIEGYPVEDGPDYLEVIEVIQ